MAVWFTADTHFGHPGALGLYRRPFTSVVEMNAAMVANWNAAVGPDDDVWHLGDFALRMSTADADALLRSLPGHKHLIVGNNDTPEVSALAAWDSVQSYAEIAVDTFRLVLCHYAFRTWNGMSKGTLNLHGHSHGRLKPIPRQIDVGVDCWGFRPVALGEMRSGTAARAHSQAQPSVGPVVLRTR